MKDLTARLAAGETLYVHCWGGRGAYNTRKCYYIERLVIFEDVFVVTVRLRSSQCALQRARRCTSTAGAATVRGAWLVLATSSFFACFLALLFSG